jgi:hypothetical protein
MTTTAVSSAKAAVVDSGEAGRSAVYGKYNNNLGHCLDVCLHRLRAVLCT